MAVSIYANILAQIEAILVGVTDIKQRFNYPVTPAKITKYPAAIYFPSELENSFETVSENFKIYRFKLFIVVGVAAHDTVANIFGTVLPEVVDEVMSGFDENWSLADIEGHRVWQKIDSGDWVLSEEGNSLEAIAELNIEVKLSTNN